MMHRAGWATKDDQQNILAITLPLIHFKTILSHATLTSFDEKLFGSMEEWKTELDKTEVRLQWDPDHDPFGMKQERKAIQIGMKGEILKKFCLEWLTEIKDVTEFVKEEYKKVLRNDITDLNIPREEVIEFNDKSISDRIGIDK